MKQNSVVQSKGNSRDSQVSYNPLKIIISGFAFALVSSIAFFLVFGIISSEWTFVHFLPVCLGGIIGAIVYYIILKIFYKNRKPDTVFKVISLLLFSAMLWICLVLSLSSVGIWD